MRGAGSSSCSLLLLLVLLLPLLSGGAPAASGVCGLGCRCYHLPEGGRAANCSRFEPAHRNHAGLPTDLRSLRVLPDAPGLASFLEERLAHHAHHLEELYLSDNEAVGPRLRSLRGLHKLRVLDLSFCELSNADQIASLVKRSNSLETLHLRGNSLTSLPVLESDTLRELDVSDCGIASVQVDSFTGLRRLRRLSLARNRITNLAADLPHSLRFLDVSSNSLTHLSPKFVAMLPRVDVSANPLHCTCALLRLRDRRTGEHVAVGAGAACTSPDQLRGLSLSVARRLCESRMDSMKTGARQRRQADPLDILEGSGGGEGDGDGVGEDDELDEETGDDFIDDDYDEEIDDGTGTGGAGETSDNSQLGPQDVGVETAVSSSSAPPVPASDDDTTRSLEDDIYEPTVPPPVPAAVDADAGAQPPSETPPESGPPAAESVEGSHAESTPDETGDVDGVHELPEDNEESEPVAAGFVPDSEGENKDGGEEEENTDIDEVFNEVMENEHEAVDEDEDYDNEDEPESTTDEISIPHPVPLDTGKEGEHETAPQPNETLSSSPETMNKNETVDSSLLPTEEKSDKDYEESEVNIEEKANEVENTDDIMAVNENIATAESTEAAPVSLDTEHTNTTLDSVVPAHGVEPHEDNEEAGTDIKFIGDAEGSGDGDNDDSLPVGPITGFIETNGHDGATTTEEPDEGTLVIDGDEETDESNSPLVPPGADDVNKIASTEGNIVAESDGNFAVVANNTDSVSATDDGEEEGSGMPFNFGMDDWEVEKANETEEEAEVTTLGPTEIHEDGLIVHHITPLESGREMSSSSEPALTTSTTEKPTGRSGLFRFNLPDEEGARTSEAPAHTALPENVGAEGVSSSTAVPDEVEEHVVSAAPVPVAEAVPSEEPAEPPAETSPPSPPVLTSELPAEPVGPEWADKEPTPGLEPDDVDQGEISEVETVLPTGETSSNDTARVIVADSEKPPEETPLNSAGSYVVLGIIMALVIFLLGYAVMRSRRGRQRAAAKANGKDAEAAGGQPEGRELKEISKPLLGTPAAVPAANGKGEHLQPLVTKPTDNPDLKDQDDGDEPIPEKPLLEPKTHIYETLNGGEKERVAVHPPSPKKSPSAAPDTLPEDSNDAINNRTPPVPEKRRVLSRLPETTVDGAPNMYAADGLPGEVVAQSQQQQPTANGAATSPVNGLSSFAPPVSPSSGRVKVVAREDPDSVPKKPVFVVNQGPSTTSGVV